MFIVICPTKWKEASMHYVFFEQELLDLQQELAQCPPLMKILQEQPDKDSMIMVAEIATYLGVILHGDYSKADILKICGDMAKELNKRRTIHLYGAWDKNEGELDISVVQNLDGLPVQ
jgi:hypothetical protein